MTFIGIRLSKTGKYFGWPITLSLNRGFHGFFGDFGLRDTFQERIALKLIEIDIDKLRVEFLAVNVDYDGLSLDFLGSRKPVHGTLVKVVILLLLTSLSWKQLEISCQFANWNRYTLSRISWALA